MGSQHRWPCWLFWQPAMGILLVVIKFCSVLFCYGVDVSDGCSDINDVVSWLLNEDTEAADVIALGREFHHSIHSGMVLGEKDLKFCCPATWYMESLLCHTSSDWFIVHDDIKFDRPPCRHDMFVENFV